MITIAIPNWHPTPLNKLMSGHWSKAHKQKKLDRLMIAANCRNIPPAEEKRRVSLTIVLGKGERKCDPDAYWKSLLDALVAAGMLVDDSSRWCELAPVTYQRGNKQTIIILENLE